MPGLSTAYGLLPSYLALVKDEHNTAELCHTSGTTHPPAQVLYTALADEAGFSSSGFMLTGSIVFPAE